jgi:hypothetical protein
VNATNDSSTFKNVEVTPDGFRRDPKFLGGGGSVNATLVAGPFDELKSSFFCQHRCRLLTNGCELPKKLSQNNTKQHKTTQNGK